MKKRKLLIKCVSLFVFTFCSAQLVFGAVIKVRCKNFPTDIRVSIYPPVENYYNADFCVPMFLDSLSDEYCYTLASTTPVFVQLQVANQRQLLFVQPNDNIEVEANYTGGKIFFSFSGANKEGQSIYNSINFNSWKIAKNISTPLLQKLQFTSPDSIFKAFNASAETILTPLDSLYNIKLIDPLFYNNAKTSLRMGLYNPLWDDLIQIMRSFESKNEMYIKAKELTELIHKEIPLSTSFSLFYPQSSSQVINYSKSWRLDHPDFIVPDYWLVYGNYWHYCMLPEKIKEATLGSIFILEKVYFFNSIDFNAAFKVYKDSFPQSPYIPIVQKLEDNDELSTGSINFVLKSSATKEITPPNNEIIIDTVNSFSSLKDVISHIAKDNDIVYMDLWATWCMPCRMSFKDYPDIYPFLQESGIKPLFISIDSTSAKVSWINTITGANLRGYHIMADRKLQEDINKLVYKKGERISIPRYVIIKNGKIINSNAPRPGEAELKKLLNNAIEEKTE